MKLYHTFETIADSAMQLLNIHIYRQYGTTVVLVL